MFSRLLAAGARGRYLPDLIIYHHVPPGPAYQELSPPLVLLARCIDGKPEAGRRWGRGEFAGHSSPRHRRSITRSGRYGMDAPARPLPAATGVRERVEDVERFRAGVRQTSAWKAAARTTSCSRLAARCSTGSACGRSECFPLESRTHPDRQPVPRVDHHAAGNAHRSSAELFEALHARHEERSEERGRAASLCAATPPSARGSRSRE